MPNWCQNKVVVSGAAELITEFKEEFIGKNEKNEKYLDFRKVIPEPDYKTTPVAETYPEISIQYAKTEEEKQVAIKNKPTIRKDSWWDWRVQNWGTKWNIENTMIYYEDRDTEILEMEFDTAWGPPDKIYVAIKLKFPDLNVSWFYHEPNMEVCGYLGRNA